jgi:CheY-like chemotaxis protein
VLRAGAYDLVLCDMVMPVKDGLETIREIRRDFPGLPVVAISGGCAGSKADLLPDSLCLGACGALRKPFRLAELLGAVEAALGKQAAAP